MFPNETDSPIWQGSNFWLKQASERKTRTFAFKSKFFNRRYFYMEVFDNRTTCVFSFNSMLTFTQKQFFSYQLSCHSWVLSSLSQQSVQHLRQIASQHLWRKKGPANKKGKNFNLPRKPKYIQIPHNHQRSIHNSPAKHVPSNVMKQKKDFKFLASSLRNSNYFWEDCPKILSIRFIITKF